MKRKRLLALVLTVAMCFNPVFPAGQKQAEAAGTLETDVSTVSKNCTMVGVYGSYYSQAQEALDYINQIRKEACEAGNVPDPRDPGRMLTSKDYVPIKWSRDLESIARIRAVEAGIGYAFMDSGHDRLNDKATFSVTYNGVKSSGECLAYNETKTMREGILQFYMEKQYWVGNNPDNQETGHYTMLINPSYTYVGVGDFYSEAGKYHNTLAAEFSKESKMDQTMQQAPVDVMQKIEVANQFISEYILDGESSVNASTEITLVPKVKLKRNNALRTVWALGVDSFESSNPSIAVVTNDGVVKGLRKGTVTITAKSGKNIVAKKEISVGCNHPKKLQSYTAATCTSTGKKIYYCAICGDSQEVEVPVKPHDYVYGEADASGNRTGVCSVCGDKITINAPTSCDVSWHDASHSERGYVNEIPDNLEVGNLYEFWIVNVDGDSAYRDMVIESTNEKVVSVIERTGANMLGNRMLVNGTGITTMTICPKYNARVGKVFNLRVGEKGSMDISQANVELSQNVYRYTGKECKPDITVSVDGDTILEKGVDYTVSYENNKSAGTANVVITGKGLFQGSSISRQFTIEEAVTGTHIHKPVTAEAVAPTCEKAGWTAGTYCSECGETITAQKKIAATGHYYSDGKCSVCGDVKYIEQAGIRYTLIEDINGKKFFSASAISKQKLSGSVKIASKFTVGKEEYQVSMIAQDAFAGQTAVTEIIVPKTVQTIGDRAFANCQSLTSMDFYPVMIPSFKDTIFENVDTQKLTISASKYAVGYYILSEKTKAQVVRNLEEKHVHTMVCHQKVEPTCEESGRIEYYTCSECGKMFRDAAGTQEILEIDTLILPLGHDWQSEFTIDIPATKDQDGEESIHCNRCDARSRITAIPATGKDDNNSSDNTGDNNNSSDNTGDNNSNKPGKDNNQSNSSNTAQKKCPKVGTAFYLQGVKYKVTAASVATKKYTVSCLKGKSKSITKLVIPDSVKYKGYTFKVTAIASKAFYGYKKLSNVTIGKNVRTIESQAFANCSRLKQIYIKTSLLTKKSVGTQVFTGIAKNIKVTMPAKKKTLYTTWFKNSGNRIFILFQ